MRNFILSFLFLCIPCLANAQDFPEPQIQDYVSLIDGIYYLIKESTSEAIVVNGIYSYGPSDPSGDIPSPEYYNYYGDIVIPEKITYYGGMELTVTGISDQAFWGCRDLTSIVIPNSVTSIGDQAFAYCSSLKSVVSNISDVYETGRDAFDGIPDDATLYVPKGLIDTYRATEDWNRFSNIVEIKNIEFADANVKAICVENWDTNHDSELNYWEASAVTDIGTVFQRSEITFFDELQYFTGLTCIGYEAFGGCSGLISIVIPNSVTSIGVGAFAGCKGLIFIEIPKSVTSIGDAAFYGCNSLRIVNCYAETVPSTDAYTFYYCYSVPIGTLHVPACAIEDYRNTEPWSRFGSIVPLDPMEFELTVSDAGVATLYLDYSVAIPEVEGMGDVMYVSDVVGRSLVLTKVENNIPAHTGVIVYAQPGTYTFTSSTTHVDACANSRLSGVTEDTPTADIDGTVYTLSVGKNQGDIGFRKFVGETLAANKAFLVRNESNEVNFFNFGIDDELTGISTTVQNVDDESAIIYDLQGRRVTSPTKGIYIVNGQKRIINNR